MVKIPRIKSGRWRFGYVSAIITCLAAGVILVAASGDSSTASQAKPIKTQTTDIAQQAPSSLPVSGSQSQTNSVANNSPVNSNKNQSNSSSNSPAGTNVPSNTAGNPAPVINDQEVTATLMVNNTVQGTVKLTVGSNQCDVLSQALADGIISQLTMKYDSRYKSHAVYQINGQGDANSVWWVYEVNDQKVSRGCDGVTVHDGDKANWKYIRS